MTVGKLPYKRLQHLVGVHLSTKEWDATGIIIAEMVAARKRGYLTKSELVKICRWKSPRAIRYIQRNRGDKVKETTRAAFASRSEEKKIFLLTGLSGVSIPMASSILTLTNPKRYGVLDIRVWQLLYATGTVDTRANGTGFRCTHWLQFLNVLRLFARKYNVRARDIERTLFNVHAMYQQGLLYSR